MKRLFLIDAYALIFRYYYAFMGREMRNRDGFNTSIVFGFTKFLRELLRREQPQLLGVAFDPPGGSFRRRLYPEYKANRAATPEDILLSVPYVKRLVEAMCIPILEVADFEADDVIGTLAHKGEAAGYEVFMVTPDKDYGQLVTDRCKIYKQKGDGVEIVDRRAIEQKYGISDPILVRDILSIWGDASDNIPGIKGIGEKGACKLVQSWGAVESILENVQSIKGKLGEKIAAAHEELHLSKRLTSIRLDVPIEFDEQALTICTPNEGALRELYEEMNFRHFLAEMATAAPVAKQKKKSVLTAERDLFSPPIEVEVEIEEEQEPQNSYLNINTRKHSYTLIESVEQLGELVSMLSEKSEFCFDTETDGFDLFNDPIVGLSFAVRPTEGWYVPMNHDQKGEYIELLRPLFESEQITKIGQNLKFDIAVLRHIGVEVKGHLIDTMLLHYLLDADSRHSMNAMAMQHLNYEPIEIETLIGRGIKQIKMSAVPLDKICEYAAEDADITLSLKEILYSKIKEDKRLLTLYNTIEEPMIRVLVDMEMAGVKIDTEALRQYGVELGGELTEIAEAIRSEAGYDELNVNSSVQLGEVLFERMKITEKPKRTKTGRYRTDEEYLQSFAGQYKIIDHILEYRGLKKLLSTYVEALPELVNPMTGRVHSSYNQAVTVTGRLSSTNPNLQNIPIRDREGRPIRRAFIPSSGDHLILSADYSQVELRIMAALSEDQHLISAFEAGEDIHTATAARIFAKSSEQVDTDDRRKAKTANFGIIYGISPFGLSQRLNISRAEAKEIIDGYFASYPAVKRYMESTIEQAQKRGYVETIFGRRRYLHDINSRNSIARSYAERNAINAPIQGSAADIMKLAMVGIWREFKQQGIKSQMIMQVHDEVVIDTLRSEEDRVREIVVEQMERAAQLSVRLVAECGVGDNWLDAH